MGKLATQAAAVKALAFWRLQGAATVMKPVMVLVTAVLIFLKLVVFVSLHYRPDSSPLSLAAHNIAVHWCQYHVAMIHYCNTLHH